jgi:hypothetical protein
MLDKEIIQFELCEVGQKMKELRSRCVVTTCEKTQYKNDLCKDHYEQYNDKCIVCQKPVVEQYHHCREHLDGIKNRCHIKNIDTMVRCKNPVIKGKQYCEEHKSLKGHTHS